MSYTPSDSAARKMTREAARTLVEPERDMVVMIAVVPL